MKKFLLSMMACVMAFGAFAQVPFKNLPVGANPTTHHVRAPQLGNRQAIHNRANGSPLTGWYDWITTYIQTYGSKQTTGMTLWPDSSVKIAYVDQNTSQPTSYYNNWVSAGMTFDPKAHTVFGDDALEKWHRYSLDSIQFYYAYFRNRDMWHNPKTNQDETVKDTLIVQWYLINPARDLWFFTDQTTGKATNFWTTVPFSRTALIGTTSAAKGVTAYTSKMILTEEDTATSVFVRKAVSTNGLAVPAGYLVAATVSFHPGVPNTFGDTLTADSSMHITNKLNEYEIFAYIDVTDASARQPLDTTEDLGLNTGLLLDKRMRYTNEMGASYGSQYAPSAEYISAWYPFFNFHITTANAGIEEAAMHNGYGVSDIYPNPTSGTANMQIALGNSENVSVRISDMLGHQVAVVAQGSFASGSHNLSFNTTGLKAGIYFVNVTAGNFAKTVKFTVQ